jgi:dTDP-4-amino-4,6-dideoxygalactose transaminase
MTAKASTLKNLYVGCPNLGDKQAFLSWVDKIWRSRRLSNDGPIVKEFEKQIEQFLGVKHAIAVCNATTGIQILADALFRGFPEINVPSFTFVATVYALEWIGFSPEFADIDPETHNIIPFYTAFPTFVTHLWGRPCPINSLNERIDADFLIFDAAHAFGCSYNNQKIGNFGGGEVFSFHATKFINSFEGGVITTNNAKTAERCKLLRNFGFVDYDNSILSGTNGKMSEIHAAMGLCSLDSFDYFVEHNRKNYEQYCESLIGLEGLKMVLHDPKNTPNYQYVVVEVEHDRDKLLNTLWANKIYARRYFYPGVHRMAHYKNQNIHLPYTEAVADRVLVLPSGTATTSRDIKRICDIIRKEVNTSMAKAKGKGKSGKPKGKGKGKEKGGKC